MRTLKYMAGILLCVQILLVAGCVNNNKKQDETDRQYAVIDKSTGKTSDYLLNITNCKKISLDIITEWVNGCEDTNGYHAYIYSDPDSWDLFIYMPTAQTTFGDIKNSNIRIEIIESTLKIYITTNSSITHDKKSDELIIHFSAPTRGAWPSELNLYIDGKLINQASSDFSL